ncbi:hypothetical protein M408DRAFT_331830 [Serendipita vermifera MAFF 305830]|uniref:Uncharacterized protein n=1 Tax=Serendipita vermifera MAFF 305830 TaxID=933852 RepID=A0A0C2WCX6_SERVB|nr:hypothetical protein M408DRAFT_331830 [Serendipita vermifera MAFF 305830]
MFAGTTLLALTARASAEAGAGAARGAAKTVVTAVKAAKIPKKRMINECNVS